MVDVTSVTVDVVKIALDVIVGEGVTLAVIVDDGVVNEGVKLDTVSDVVGETVFEGDAVVVIEAILVGNCALLGSAMVPAGAMTSVFEASR